MALPYERLNAHVWLGVNYGPSSFEAARVLIRESYRNFDQPLVRKKTAE